MDLMAGMENILSQNVAGYVAFIVITTHITLLHTVRQPDPSATHLQNLN